MSDIWAFCDRCARWFYCAQSGGAPGHDCPACGSRSVLTRQGRPPRPAFTAGEPAVAPQETQDA